MTDVIKLRHGLAAIIITRAELAQPSRQPPAHQEDHHHDQLELDAIIG